MASAMTTLVMSVLLAVSLYAQAGQKGAVLSANTASESELLQVPHMTPALAKAVLARRPFATVRDLDALLNDLSRQQRTELYRGLFVPVNLNTATDGEILLIPGLGQRMLHEFKEYRPYKSIDQFRREIGKYVSKREVARLEQYVTLGE